MQQQFLKKFFPSHRTNSFKRQITTFTQKIGETFYQCFATTWQHLGDPAGRPMTRATRENPDETRCFFFPSNVVSVIRLLFLFLHLLYNELLFANAPVVHGSWPDKDKLVEKFVAMREASLGKETHK
jgi:hypothetical protein